MSECVILFRFPNSGRIGILGDDDKVSVFGTHDDATATVEQHPLFLAGYPFQIVELEI